MVEFLRQVIARGGSLTITLPIDVVKFYDIHEKDFCTLEFIKNHREGNKEKSQWVSPK